MVKELNVFPSPGTFWSTPPLGPPLVFGDLLFAITGNGRDNAGKLIAPRAPSFVALHKKTGKLAWQSNLPGENIIEGQWSSPTLAHVNGSPQVIFAGGDCVSYSLAPETGKLLWKCDCLPERQKKNAKSVDNYIVGTPVVVGDRLFVGLGVTAEHARPPASSYFLCLDITKKGDVSLKSYDPKDARNKNSALVWAFGGLVNPPPKDKDARKTRYRGTLGTAAVHEGLVYITETHGYLHCLDAVTGERLWVHDFLAAIWGSPYWVDNRVFVGTESGEMVIFAHGRAKKVLATIGMEEVMVTTPIAANGVLYVATRSKLFAIGSR